MASELPASYIDCGKSNWRTTLHFDGVLYDEVSVKLFIFFNNTSDDSNSKTALAGKNGKTIDKGVGSFLSSSKVMSQYSQFQRENFLTHKKRFKFIFIIF